MAAFPDLTFLLFTVAHDAEDLVLLLVQAGSQGHTYANAQSLTEGAGGYFYAGQFEPVRVSLKWRTQFAQRDHVVEGTEFGKSEPQVEAGSLMPSGPDDPVTIRPVGIPRVMIGNLQVQGRSDVHDGQRPTCVAGASRMQSDQVITTHQVGGVFQFLNGIVAENLPAFGVGEGHVPPFRGRTKVSAEMRFSEASEEVEHRL